MPRGSKMTSTCTISPPLDTRGAVLPVKLIDGSPVLIYHTKMPPDPFDRTEALTEPLRHLTKSSEKVTVC